MQFSEKPSWDIGRFKKALFFFSGPPNPLKLFINYTFSSFVNMVSLVLCLSISSVVHHFVVCFLQVWGINMVSLVLCLSISSIVHHFVVCFLQVWGAV
jgi:hypothetical protein